MAQARLSLGCLDRSRGVKHVVDASLLIGATEVLDQDDACVGKDVSA